MSECITRKQAVARAVVLPRDKPPPPMVVLLTEGNSVSVMVQPGVRVMRIDRPVCETPAGNDYADEQVRTRLGWIDRLYHRMTFFTNALPIRRRQGVWPLAYDVQDKQGKRQATVAGLISKVDIKCTSSF